MANGNEEARFSIKVDAPSDQTDTAASSLENLRKRIVDGDAAVKVMSSDLRRLKGSTAEVKAAKDQLKAKIDAEKAAISGASLAIMKQGSSFEKLNASMKKTKQATAQTEGSMQSLKTIALAAKLQIAQLVSEMLRYVGALVKWSIGTMNAERSMQLMREATLGSAEQAENLGTQIDALAKKVPISKEKLNELAISLSRTRMSGGAIVDTMAAVSQASAAMGDEVGNQFKEMMSRGAMWGRMQISPLELEHTGVKFEDIASTLAQQMKIGIGQARAALFEGRVKLEDGAKAMKAALEKRFGDVNLRKMLDLNVIAEKMHETFAKLTSGIKLEPLLQAFAKLGELFDESTIEGAALKDMMTAFGNDLISAFSKSLPYVKKFFQGMIIAGLDIAIVFYKVRNALVKAFGGSDTLKNFDYLKMVMIAGKAAAYGLAAAVTVTAAALALVLAPVVALWAGISKLGDVFDWVKAKWKEFDAWNEGLKAKFRNFGSDLINGFTDGIKNTILAPVRAVESLGDKLKEAFTRKLDMHSPSKLFAEYGKFTTEGYAQGIEGGSARASGAVADMVDVPKALPAGGGKSSGAVTVNVTINAGGGEGAAKAISAPSFLEQLTKAIQDALQGAGVPT